MSVRRNSKIFCESPGDSDVFLGQAPPGSQRPALFAASSASVLEQPISDLGDIPVFRESVQAPVPSRNDKNGRRKSNASSAGTEFASAESLGLTNEVQEQPATTATKVGRRKSNATLSIATDGPGAEPSATNINAPLSAKAASTPKSSKQVVHIKDSNKRASSRLMLEKEKSIARNIKNANPEEAQAEDDRKNGIDFDTCCIFIF